MLKRTITISALMMAACSSEPAEAPRSEVAEAGFAPVELRFEAAPLNNVETDAMRSVANLESAVQFYSDRFENSRSWLDASSAAEAELGVGRLTGDVERYLWAEEQLSRAFDAAAPGTGPFLARANYHMTVHQVGAVTDDLEQAEKKIFLTDSEDAAIAGLRGDIAFHTGDLSAAIAHYERAEAIDPSLASAGRLANFALRTGEYDEAAELYELAASRVDETVDPGALSWARLHQGIVELERSKIAEAAQHFRAAGRTFTGWYLIEEHLAETYFLQGQFETAAVLYEDIVQRVPNGEFLGALAETYEAMGRDEDAADARDRALAAFERDLVRLPSATSGHALDFFLQFDRPRALEVARANFATRPGHEARTKLAQALLATGDADAAIEVLTPTTQTAWATPDYLATAAIVFASADPALARTSADAAEGIQPGAVQDLRESLSLD